MSVVFPLFRGGGPLAYLLGAGLLVVAWAHPASATDARKTAAAAAASFVSELRHAVDDAVREAKLSTDIDPAYELLGLADTAQQQQLTDVALQAANGFADLVKRATARALKAGNPLLQDILDQYVDLRVMAGSGKIRVAQVALDEGMGTLFPPALLEMQRRIEGAVKWDDKIAMLNDLAQLQASATQVKFDSAARDVANVFDQDVSHMEGSANAEADASERERKLETLADARRTRADHVREALANNIDIIAQQMEAKRGADEDSVTTPTRGGLESAD